MEILIGFIGLSFLCALTLWAACRAAAKAGMADADYKELAAHWPDMPDLEDNDIFADKYTTPK